LTGVQDISTAVEGAPANAATPLTYPNPSADAFYLRLPYRTAMITAIDTQGRQVFSGSYTDAFGRDWRPGLYTIRIEIEGVLVTERVVKQ
jgi:hypothetical protein